MRFFIFIVLSFFFSTIVGQTFSESEIKKVANQVNEQISGLDFGNGIRGKGCLSVGRTLIYQYDVPSFWEPPLNIKKEVIANFKRTHWLELKDRVTQDINIKMKKN